MRYLRTFVVLSMFVGLCALGNWTVPTHGLTLKVNHGPTMPPGPDEP